MKKTVFLVLLLSLFFLASCKTDDGTNGEEKKEVTMVIEVSETEIYDHWKEQFEEYYKEEGYKIKFVYVAGGQVQGKQDNLMAAGSPSDIIVGGDVYISNQYRYLVDLTELLTKDDEEVDKDDFIPELIDAVTWNEGIYYLPNFFNSSLLYYNIDLFDQYNAGVSPDLQITYPSANWSYNDFLNAGKKLTIGSGNSFSQWGSFSTIGWWGEWLIHIRQHGGEMMNAQGKVTLDTPEALSGFQAYLDKMSGTNKISYRTGELELGGFAGGLTAMSYGGHMKDWVDYQSLPDLNWDVELLPKVGENRTGEFAVNGLGIHKDSKAKTASWNWLKFLTQKRTGEELLEHPYVSVRISERDELLAIPREERKAPHNLEAVYESIQHNRVLPQFRYFTYVTTTIIQTELTKAVEGSLTAEEALRRATQYANQYINANYN